MYKILKSFFIKNVLNLRSSFDRVLLEKRFKYRYDNYTVSTPYLEYIQKPVGI